MERKITKCKNDEQNCDANRKKINSPHELVLPNGIGNLGYGINCDGRHRGFCPTCVGSRDEPESSDAGNRKKDGGT